MAGTTKQPPAHGGQEEWKAVAREVLRAFDVVVTPALRGIAPGERGPVAAAHVPRGRELLEPIVQRYITAARTQPGRAWRRRRALRSPYVAAFTEAAAYTAALGRDDHEHLPWPALFSHGRLPLLDRFTGNRRALGL